MSEITPEILAEAKADGWAEKDAWRGPEESWVDAAEFVRRKHTVLPLLRKENEKVNARLAETTAALTEVQANMAEFIKYQQEQTVAKLAEQRKTLLGQKRAAEEAGDDDQVVRLEEQLDANAEAKAAAKVVKAPAPPVTPIPLELKAWQEANPWFGADQRKTAMAMQLGREAVQAGLAGKPYFDYIDRGIKDIFAPSPREGKSEGGGPSGQGGSSGAPATGKYTSLPPEAKAACDADAKRFVGANKLFKTEAAWRDHYTTLYFQE